MGAVIWISKEPQVPFKNRFEDQRPVRFWVFKIIRNEEPSIPVNSKILKHLRFTWRTDGFLTDYLNYFNKKKLKIVVLSIYQTRVFDCLEPRISILRTSKITSGCPTPPPGFLISATHLKISRGGHGSCGLWSGAGRRRRPTRWNRMGVSWGLHTRAGGGCLCCGGQFCCSCCALLCSWRLS